MKHSLTGMILIFIKTYTCHLGMKQHRFKSYLTFSNPAGIVILSAFATAAL